MKVSVVLYAAAWRPGEEAPCWMERDRDVGTPLLDHEDPSPPANIHPVIPGYEHMVAGRGTVLDLTCLQ
jgi:hypothetical protein